MSTIEQGELEDKLRELAEKWRVEINNPWNEYQEGIQDATNACADELEDLLER